MKLFKNIHLLIYKLICIISLLSLWGCIIGNGKIIVEYSKKSSLEISVTNIQVINNQFIITGTNLNHVTAFQIKDGATTTDLQIESKGHTSIVANTLANVSFAVGTIFDFVLSNAQAASSYQVTFINSNNSITAAMLTSMGATSGQIMKYNGTAWVATSLTSGQNYLGTWNASTNVPDLTIPSSISGEYYIVSTGGTFNAITYDVGDWIISDGSAWQKIQHSSYVVSSFNGRQGIVTLVPGDYVSLKNGSGKVTGSSLNDLADINIVTPLNGSVLKYDTATSKWIVGVDDAGAGAYTGTANRAVTTDGAGALTTSATTATELGYVAGVTSSIQTQLGTKQSSALADGKILVGNGSGVAAAVTMSGDALLSNAGVITLKNTGTAGTYTSVTTDAQGRVTAGTNPAVAAITALTGDVTASGTGSVAASIATSAVNSAKILDGAILPSDLDFTGTNIGTSGLVIRNLTGGFTPLVCSTAGYVPTWTVTGFICQAIPVGDALSSITAATATNTIDNLNFAQLWDWSTGTTQNLMTMKADALTTGSILNLSTSNASVNSTNGLLNVANTGASTSGVLARLQSNSTAGSGLTVLNSGNVLIGTATPDADTKLKIDNTSASSNIAAIGIDTNTTIQTSAASTFSSIKGIKSSATFQPTLAGINTSNNIVGVYGAARFINFAGTSSVGQLNGGEFYAQNAGQASPTSMSGVKTQVDIMGVSATNVYGTQNNVQIYNASGANTIYGSYNNVTHTGTAVILPTAYGAYNNITLNNINGTITSATAGYFGVTKPSGTLGTGYGVYINTIAGTTNYGLYQASATNNNYFAGKVGIGFNAPTTALQVAGIIAPEADATRDIGTSSLRFKDIYASNNVIQTSDARLKKGILDSDLGLQFINKLRPVSYYWRDGKDRKLHYGLIAQETEEVLAEEKQASGRQHEVDNVLVTHDKKTDRYGIRYSELISPLIKAVQELFGKVEELIGRIIKAEDNVEIKKMRRDFLVENAKLKKENEIIKARLLEIEKLLMDKK